MTLRKQQFAFALALLAGCAALLAANAAHAAYASAYASIVHSTGSPSDQDSNSDSGLNYAEATADADCPAQGCAGFSTANAKAYSQAAGTYPGLNWKIVEDVTTSDSDSVLPNHSYTHRGTADYWKTNATLAVAGAVHDCKLAMESIGVRVPQGDPANQTTIEMNLAINDTPEFTGTFTIDGSGNTSGDGVYDPGNFEVSTDGDFLVAEYTGPESYDFQLPGDSERFDLEFDIDTDANSAAGNQDDGRGNTQLLSMHTPAVIIPEPTAAWLLGLGALALLQRRHRRQT